MYMTFAASSRDVLRLKRQHREIVGKPATARNWIEALHQLGDLRGDAGRVASLVIVVIGAVPRADLAILFVERRGIVAKRDQRRSGGRRLIGAKRESLSHVGAMSDAAGDDELHLAMHVGLL